MALEEPDEESIFNTARRITSMDERQSFLAETCGNDAALRTRLEKLLAAYAEESHFLEQPAPGLEQCSSPVASGENLAASLHAGLASAFSAEEAVVMGDGNHSVLKQLARTMVCVPRVSLREPTAEGPEPIVRPSSAEVPQPEWDSRYRIDGEIARGGMGAIFKGRDTDLGRDLAIKVLLDSHKDKPEIIQRFVEEAQIGGQLQHPGIAPIYELGQFPDKRPFFAMKLVKGETLSKLLADRRDSTEDRGKFIGIFEQICQTMAYAHSRGVIHRDLKPANIMVGAFGEVQVMDWGLAKVLASGGVADEKKAHDKLQGQSIIQTLRSQTDSDVPQKFGTLGTHTQLGSVMGTPAYMPPEQALGEIDHLDERADVFGLGAILCEILTGKPPYTADGGTLLFRMASRGKLTDCFLRLDNSGAENDLVELTKQCLELEPADRPRNARVLAQRISEYLASVETRLRKTEIERATQAERAVAESRQVELQRRSASKLRKLVAVLAGVALVAATAFGAALVSNQRANQLAITALKNEATANYFASEAAAKAMLASENASRASSEADLARKEAERAEAATKQANEQLIRSEWLLYASKLMLAQNDFESDNGTLVAHYLNECQPNLRGWEHRYLATRVGARQTLMGHTRSVTSVAFSPDDTLIVTGSWDGSAIVWNSQIGQVAFRLAGHRGEVMSVAFSSDGRRIVTGSTDTTARVWDAKTGLELQVFKGHTGPVKAVAFSPDGEYIAVGSGEPNQPGELTVWNAQTDQRHLVLNEFSGAVRSVAWSPDGKQIVTGSGFLVSVWDAETGLERMSFRHGGVLGGIWCLAFSPDGTRIATGAEDGKTKVWDAKTGLVLHSLNGHTAGVASVAFSPDGKHVVTGAWDNTVRTWEAERGEELNVIKGHADWVLGVAFSADGRRIVSGSVDTTAKVWDARNGQNVTAIKCAPIGGVASVAFSPDSKRIVIAGEKSTGKLQEDYAANIWDVETGQELIALRGHTDSLQSVAFSPDGLRIATGSRDKTVREWDATTGQQLRVLEGHTSPVTYSPDNAVLATGHVDKFLKLLDTETGQVIRSLDVHEGRLRSVAFSPDGTRIVTASDDEIARSPTENGIAKVWNTMTGEQLNVLDGVLTNMFSPQTVAFSPDGQYILTVCRDNLAKVWETATAQEFLVLKGHTAHLTSVAFSPDGQRVITGSFDKSAKLWELERGLEVFSFNGHPNEVTSVAFSPDGRCVVTGTWNTDNTLRVWRSENEAVDHAWPLPDTAERIRDHLEQAEAAERENHLFAAEFHLQRVLRDDPENVAARKQLAAVHHTIPFTIAFQQRNFALAASIWNEAITADAILGDDRRTQHTYNAACAAALAAEGQGQQESPLDDASKAKLRIQALTWLKAELKVWDTLLATGGPEVRPLITFTLKHWQQDPDLAGIRDSALLSRIPSDEQAELSVFWAEVQALLAKAEIPS